MKKITNVFVLTTEYHFMLSISIILSKYSSGEFRNVLVFTGPRLSDVKTDALPSYIEVVEISIDTEVNLKEKIHQQFFSEDIQNVFVFIAYRFLETYVLSKISKTVKRHLVQDGANFYYEIKKSVFISRLKETIKIYRNLWSRGFFFTNPVLYKKHQADSALIDFVWITNPEIYQEPAIFKRPVRKIELLQSESDKEILMKCFSGFQKGEHTDHLIYLSTRLTQPEAIQLEIDLIKSVAAKFKNLTLLVKLHPYSLIIQVDQFRKEFGMSVIKNYVPAELYIMNAKNSRIIGSSSAGMFYENPLCKYFSLEKIYQNLKLAPRWIEIKFPLHVRKVESLDEF